MWRNTDRSWGRAAKLLHWSVAALVFVQTALGLAAVGWRLSPTKLDLFVWHKSTGMLILVLMVLRLGWRLANPVPALPADMPRWERGAAAAGHAMLYLLLLLLPLSGWGLSSASGVPFRVFWVLPLPPIVAPDREVAAAAARVHGALAAMLVLAVAVHIAAALRHHYRRHDDVLARMLPGRGGA